MTGQASCKTHRDPLAKAILPGRGHIMLAHVSALRVLCGPTWTPQAGRACLVWSQELPWMGGKGEWEHKGTRRRRGAKVTLGGHALALCPLSSCG